MRRAEKAARHADLCRRSRLFSRCSRFGEKNRTDRARDRGYLFPIRPRNQKLLRKKLTISFRSSLALRVARADSCFA